MGVMSYEETLDVSCKVVIPPCSKGALGAWRSQCGARTLSRDHAALEAGTSPLVNQRGRGVCKSVLEPRRASGQTHGGKPRSEPDWGKPTVRDRRGACGIVVSMGAGLRPNGKLLDKPPDPAVTCAPHFYPDPQGAVASPLLANVFLHYVFDLWAHQWRRREATGNVVVVRYADDIVAGFEHEADARRFWDAMRTRFEQFGLELHGEKTRLLEFGRQATARRQRKGLGRPETFTFLGFTFICGKSRRGAFQLKRKTRGDRMRAKLREVKEQLRDRMHDAIPEQGRWLKAVVTGFFAYHAVPTNSRALGAFRYHVTDLWRRTLRRRSQKDAMTWERMMRIAAYWLPAPRILHPWPEQRFAVKHPR